MRKLGVFIFSILATSLVVPASAQTHYLYVAGGRATAAGAPGIAPEDEANSDINLRSVLVADVDSSAKSVSNWRRAGTLPLTHPDSPSDQVEYTYIHDSVNTYNGRLYVGPSDFSGTAIAANFVTYADINPDGTLGTFQISDRLPGSPANQVIGATEIVEVNGTPFYYILGGNSDSGQTARILYAEINSSTGAIGAWNTATGVLPVAEWFHAFTSYNGMLIGNDGNLNTTAAQVWTATPAVSGDITSAFSTTTYTTDFTTRWDNLTLVAGSGANDYVYILGGTTGTTLDRVDFAPVGSVTNSGSWATTTVMPGARRRLAGAATGDMIIITGGSSTTSFALGVPDVFVGTVASNGSITWKTDADASVDPMIHARSYGGAAIAPIPASVSDWTQY